MTPPAKVQSVPTAVIVFGWIPRRTSQLATGSMTLRYPFLSQSGRIFMRLGLDAKQRAIPPADRRDPSHPYTPHIADAIWSHREHVRNMCEHVKPQHGSGRKSSCSTEL